MRQWTVATALVLLTASSAPASGPVARAEGMGGAYSAFAAGSEGMWWNPAVLGSQLLFSANLGGGLEAGNNALTVWQLAMLATGAAKAKSDAVTAVGKVGADGWNADARTAEGAAAAVSLPVIGAVGLGVFPQTVIGATHVTKDALQFALHYDPNNPLAAFGNPPTPGTYDLGGAFTEATFTEIAVGYAREVPIPGPGVSLTAGAAVKYLLGQDFRSAALDQKVTVGTAPSVSGSGVTYQSASTGSGVVADLGVHAKLLGMAKAGVVVKNIGSSDGIKWKATQYAGALDTGTLGLVSTKSSRDVPFKLPLLVRAGVGGTVPIVGTSAGVDLDADTTNKRNRIRVGAEQSLLGMVTARVGYVTKAAPYDAQVTVGAGVGALIAGADVAVGFPTGGGGAKGGSVALSAYLSF